MKLLPASPLDVGGGNRGSNFVELVLIFLRSNSTNFSRREVQITRGHFDLFEKFSMDLFNKMDSRREVKFTSLG